MHSLFFLLQQYCSKVVVLSKLFKRLEAKLASSLSRVIHSPNLAYIRNIFSMPFMIENNPNPVAYLYQRQQGRPLERRKLMPSEIFINQALINSKIRPSSIQSFRPLSTYENRRTWIRTVLQTSHRAISIGKHDNHFASFY